MYLWPPVCSVEGGGDQPGGGLCQPILEPREEGPVATTLGAEGALPTVKRSATAGPMFVTWMGGGVGENKPICIITNGG